MWFLVPHSISSRCLYGLRSAMGELLPAKSVKVGLYRVAQKKCNNFDSKFQEHRR